MSAEPLSPFLVDEREAARLMGVCAKTLYNLRKGSELPFVSIGTRIMYDPADLRRFIERKKEAANG